MKQLSKTKMESIEGGLVECIHVTGNHITFYLFIDEAGRAFGWQIADDNNPTLACQFIPNPS